MPKHEDPEDRVKPEKQLPDPSIVEDLIHHYTIKRRITQSKYRYISTIETDKHIAEAALLCSKYRITPDRYVCIAYDNIGGKKEYFNTSYLSGPKMRKLLETETSPAAEGEYKVELTRANLSYMEIWEQQLDLASRLMRSGESLTSILMDPALKFYAWFRIMCTPDRIPDVVQRYKLIARKELNNKLKEFLTSQGMDVNRILD
jgi:hypothetical protein